MIKEDNKKVNRKKGGVAMKKKSNSKLIAGIVGFVALLGISFGVYAMTNSSDGNDKAPTEQTTNRTQNQIEAKSNVAKTPIVQPRDGKENSE